MSKSSRQTAPRRAFRAQAAHAIGRTGAIRKQNRRSQTGHRLDPETMDSLATTNSRIVTAGACLRWGQSRWSPTRPHTVLRADAPTAPDSRRPRSTSWSLTGTRSPKRHRPHTAQMWPIALATIPPKPTTPLSHRRRCPPGLSRCDFSVSFLAGQKGDTPAGKTRDPYTQRHHRPVQTHR